MESNGEDYISDETKEDLKVLVLAGKMQNCASRPSVVGGGGAQRVFRQADHLHLLEPAMVKLRRPPRPSFLSTFL